MQAKSRNGAVKVAWRLLVRYSVRLQRRLNSDRKSFETFLGLDVEKGCFAAPWVELRRLLSESQSSSSERRRTHGTPKMNSWRFFEGSSTSAIVRRQRPAPGQVMLHQQQLEQAAFFCLLVNDVDPRSYNYAQSDDMRDSNPTFSCCLARVAIPCQVQQPGTAPPSGSKRSFFPLLFLPLLIEEQRWNLEQQISEVKGTLWCKKIRNRSPPKITLLISPRLP